MLLNDPLLDIWTYFGGYSGSSLLIVSLLQHFYSGDASTIGSHHWCRIFLKVDGFYWSFKIVWKSAWKGKNWFALFSRVFVLFFFFGGYLWATLLRLYMHFSYFCVHVKSARKVIIDIHLVLDFQILIPSFQSFYTETLWVSVFWKNDKIWIGIILLRLACISTKKIYFLIFQTFYLMFFPLLTFWGLLYVLL